jgi:PAS domain S-box-containing protein
MSDISQGPLHDRLFHDLLEASADAVVIIDRSQSILFVNTQAEGLFGYPPGELPGVPLNTLIPERNREAHVNLVDQFFESPSVRAMGRGLELFAKRKDNAEIPVDIALTALDTSAGLLVAATIRDVSERKIAEDHLRKYAAELKRSNDDLEVFAYAASHDLQAPVRRVRQFAELLQCHYKDRLDDEANEFIGYIVFEAGRMQSMIQGLLAYSRVGSHARPFVPTAFSEVIEEVTARLESSMQEQGARVTYGAMPTLSADPTQIEQLFQNLIENALKYRSERPPVIEIVAEAGDGHWIFKVSDNGIGIDPSHRDRVFCLFGRLPNQDGCAGTGIGLATCKRIVEHHGGQIWVDSQLGEGSTFGFTIPAA